MAYSQYSTLRAIKKPTGESWLFLKLVDDIVYVDTRQYYIEKLDALLGVLEMITRQYAKI